MPVRAGLWLSPPHAVNNRKLTLEPVSPKIAAAAFAVWRRLRARSEPRLSSSRGACEQRWRRACHSLVITRPPRRRWMGARAVARASSGVARGAYRGRRPVAGRQSAAGGAPGAVHCRRDVPDPQMKKLGHGHRTPNYRGSELGTIKKVPRKSSRACPFLTPSSSYLALRSQGCYQRLQKVIKE